MAVFTGTTGNDTLNGGAENDVIDGGAGNDVLTGGAGNDTLLGGTGSDYLAGGSGDDLLMGGEGADNLYGDAGNDTLDGGVVIDRINYSDINYTNYFSATSGVVINLSGVRGDGSTGQGTVTGDASVGIDTLININNIGGSNFNDVIIGSSASIFEAFEGGAGDDTIDGGVITANSNRVTYQSANASVVVNLANGTATGGAGNDVLLNINSVRGSVYADFLMGSDRTNFVESFEGREGNDTINGAGGNDEARYDNTRAAVVVNLATGVAQDGYGTIDTLINVESVVGSVYNDTITGSDDNNTLEGRGGDDLLLGGAGADTLVGGAGNDTLNGGIQLIANGTTILYSQYDLITYANATSAMIVTLGADGLEGRARGGNEGVDVLIDIEYIVGSAHGDTISGSNRAVTEVIRGNAGDDTLSGGAGGVDLGINIVDYQRASGSVTVNLALGTSSGADGNDVLSGFQGVIASAYDDFITGNDADNLFSDRGGNDTYQGGAGIDTVGYQLASGSVTLNLSTNTTGGAAGSDQLISIENLSGSAFSDTLIGDGQANFLRGEAGNDTIDGGAGIDTVGFTGNLANYTLSKSGTTYTVRANTGTDGTDTLKNVEYLKFADTTVNLQAKSIAAAAPLADVQRISELYVAFFNRTPDADGLAYWIGQKMAGQSINQISEAFYNVGASSTFSALTGFSTSMSNADFLNVFYKNVLGRPEGADAGGLAYWNGKLADGSSTRSSLANDILDSAHTFKGNPTWGWVADLLDNKIAVANTIAVEWGLTYNTDAYARGVAIAAAITPTDTAAALALVGVVAADFNIA